MVKIFSMHMKIFSYLHHTDELSSQDSNFTKEQVAEKLNILQAKIFTASYYGIIHDTHAAQQRILHQVMVLP